MPKHICLRCGSSDTARIVIPDIAKCGACGKKKRLYIKDSIKYQGRLCRTCYLRKLTLSKGL